MHRFAGLCLIPVALTSQAWAEPCIGAGFDVPLPGATRVERRFTDVSSARFYGVWQEGRIAGLVYQLSSDYSGMLAPRWESPEWQITIVCDPLGSTCAQESRGEVAPDAAQVAELLVSCLTGEEVTAEAFAQLSHAPKDGLPADAGVTDLQRPIHPHVGIAMVAGAIGARGDDSVAESVPTVAGGETVPNDGVAIAHGAPHLSVAEDQALAVASRTTDTDTLGPSVHPPESCGLEAIDPGPSPVLTLQRLLASGGYDPGPTDGLMGQKTRRALSDALGADALDLSIVDAIEALDTKLCDS